MSEQQEDKIVNKKVVGSIDLPKFKADKYLGKEVMIDEVEIREGQYGYYAKVKALIEPKCDELNDEPLYASKIIGLVETENGNLAWGKDTKADKFMTRMNASSLDDLKGKVVITSRQGESEFITF